MGSSQSKHIDINKTNLSEWKQIGLHRQMSKIMHHPLNNTYAQLQTIPFNPKHDLQKQLQIYQYRKTQNNSLVKCYAIQQSQLKSTTICGSNQALKVLTQRIPLRLNQLPQLSFPQTIYTLCQSLRGYKDCYNKLGPFDIDEQMIGVNQNGQVKVWVNQNFAQNHPIVQKPLLQTTGSIIKPNNYDSNNKNSNQQDLVSNSLAPQQTDQTNVVNNIFQVIQRKNQSGRYPQQFSNKIYSIPLTFDQAFGSIQRYVKQKNLFVPNKLASFANIINLNKNQMDFPYSIDRTSNNSVARQLFTDPKPNTYQRISSPINYNQNNNPSTISRVNSPIKVLFQQPSSVGQNILSPRKQIYSNNIPMSPRSQAVGSKITFRLVQPQTSNISFQNQNSQYVNRN